MRRILLLGILLLTSSIPGGALGQPAITSEIAPTGKLRVAMNAGTPVMLMRTPDGKITGGVGLEMGKFIAQKLGLPFELVPYPNSDAYIQSFGKREWDVGFGPQTPLVAEKADFIVDLLLNDYLYVAAPGREFADAAQVDRPGVKIGVGKDSASDQFLSRTLKSAELVRRSGVDQGFEAIRSGEVDVWAASASNIEQLANRVPGAKIVPGTFTSDRSMLILPKGRSSESRAKLTEIVNEAKKTGVVRKALEQTGVKGVRAAPD
jgi:polar amino acid transport system substrate-binding protein